MRFYLNISYPPTLCAGREYSIAVTPLVELDGKRADGQKFNYQDRIIPGVEITAEIADQNIATVDPAKPKSKRSGYLPASPLGTTSLADQEKFGNLGEVVFKIKAKKAGSTNMYLTAKVPRQWSGGRDRYFGPQGMPTGGPIKVVNCDYRVTVTYWWEFAGEWGRMWNSGYLNTKITARDPEFYGGDGSFGFLMSHFDITGCSKMTSHQYETQLSGRLNDTADQLELTLNVGNPSGTIAETCPNTFLLANMGVAAASESWRAAPLSFPVSGGTQRFTFVAPRQGQPTQGLPAATVTVSVQPIIETGGK